MQENMIGQNIIITEPCKNLRALGRNALRGYWKIGILATLVYMVCLNLPKAIMDHLFGYNPANYIASDGYTYNMDIDFYNYLYNSLPQDSLLGDLYVIAISGSFALGLALVFLGIFRKQSVRVKDVFLGFEQFPKALGLMLYEALFIILWSFLFIIPGIIASIRYSQAFYILADDPTKSIPQCVNESKEMMRGNKGKYFLLMLSFIGWIALSSIPAALFQQIFIHATTNDFVLTLAMFVSTLFLVPVTVYMNSTQVGFYEILAGHLIKETQPAPVTPALQAALEESARNMEEEAKAEESTAEKTAEDANQQAALPVGTVAADGEIQPETKVQPETETAAHAFDIKEAVEAETYQEPAVHVEPAMPVEPAVPVEAVEPAVPAESHPVIQPVSAEMPVEEVQTELPQTQAAVFEAPIHDAQTDVIEVAPEEKGQKNG